LRQAAYNQCEKGNAEKKPGQRMFDEKARKKKDEPTGGEHEKQRGG
jgi:hypothetical protein